MKKITGTLLLFFAIGSTAYAGIDPELPLNSLRPGQIIQVDSIIDIVSNSFGNEFMVGISSPVMVDSVMPASKCWMARSASAFFNYSIPIGTQFQVKQVRTEWTDRKNVLTRYPGGSSESSAAANFITRIALEDNSAHIANIGCWVWDKAKATRFPAVYDFTTHFGKILSILP